MTTSSSASDRRLVLATGNRAKGRELAALLIGLPYRVEDLSAYPQIVLPPEGEVSYQENALGKARAVTRAIGTLALADDSGIEVDALGGAPGVRSARFSGEQATDEDNNAKLIDSLDGVPYERRSARYRCVAVLVTPDGEEIAGIGSCEGRIGFEPRGTGGFGYDPWFIPERESRTMAELTAEEKHAISHRGKALRGLADKLRDL